MPPLRLDPQNLPKISREGVGTLVTRLLTGMPENEGGVTVGDSIIINAMGLKRSPNQRPDSCSIRVSAVSIQ